MGANQEETFAKILNQKSGLTVLNTAISSYGTAREMQILRRVKTDRLKYLIIQYCGNDYDENKEFYLTHNVLDDHLNSSGHKVIADVLLKVINAH